MKLKLFLISFFILFLELTLIRVIPAYIRYVSYFSNLILLASFAGIGLGTLFHKSIKLPLYFIPLSITLLATLLRIFKYDLIISSDQVIYYTLGIGEFTSNPAFLLPLIFFSVVTVFLVPSKNLGDLLAKTSHLEGYSINIVASILGVISFTLLSYLNSGPLVWFSLLIIISIIFINPDPRKHWYYFLYLLVIFGLESQFFAISPQSPSTKEIWSPYYKINLYPLQASGQNYENFYSLNVNNIGHQTLIDPDTLDLEKFYQYPYILFPDRRFQHALIIGSGAGNDVAKALRESVSHITAIDIDPQIINIGRQYHPNQPYQDPRVNVVINDGRNYLINTTERYDLVILALTDSLTLSNANANLRLESYLYTLESLQTIKNKLTTDGIFVMYNYYRQPWLVNKLGLLAQQVFNRTPTIYSFPTQIGPAAIIISSTQPVTIPAGNVSITHDSDISIPTDDWPFLYLKSPSIPNFYIKYLSLIFVPLFLFLIFQIKKQKIQFNYSLFFMGAAFMLLETKNVVQFSLLFGSTWLTNSLVFIGLLVMVLTALRIAKIFPNLSTNILFLILFATLAFNYLFSSSHLLTIPYLPRLLISILINFSPVLLANVIFAQIYRHTKVAPLAYGSNILGSFVGGILEYTSMIWGYRQLILLVALFYLISLLRVRKTP